MVTHTRVSSTDLKVRTTFIDSSLDSGSERVNLVFRFCFQIKCEQYWPNEGAELYGDIEVTVTDWIEFANYTITTLQICKVNNSDLFTCWSFNIER